MDFLRLALDVLGNGLAVQRLHRQRLQDEHVEGAAEQLTSR
jgi:hypothetical protein